MSLFSCCPKKPKKTLDYVIKWVEDTDKTIKELDASIKELEDWDENISELVAEAIENYDWSNLPVEALSRKADKVEDAVQGNLAALDSNGNLVDSGAGIGTVIEEDNTNLVPSGTIYNALQGKINKIVNATPGDFAGFDENGNLTDSGKKPADFADKIHHHSYIRGEVEWGQVLVFVDEDSSSYPMVTFQLKETTDPSNPSIEEASISFDNISNFKRALEDPVKSTDTTPTYDDSKLITAGGVKAALDGKRDLIGQSISLTIGGQEIEIEPSDVPNLIRALSDPDNTPTEDSDNLVTSRGVYDALNVKADNPVSLKLEKDMTAGYYYLYDSNGENTNADNIASVKALLAAITSGTVVSCKVLFKLGSGNTYYLLGYVSWAKFRRLGDYDYIIKLNVADKSYKCIIASSSETISGIADSEFPEKWEVTTLSL